MGPGVKGGIGQGAAQGMNAALQALMFNKRMDLANKQLDQLQQYQQDHLNFQKEQQRQLQDYRDKYIAATEKGAFNPRAWANGIDQMRQTGVMPDLDHTIPNPWESDVRNPDVGVNLRPMFTQPAQAMGPVSTALSSGQGLLPTPVSTPTAQAMPDMSREQWEP